MNNPSRILLACAAAAAFVTVSVHQSARPSKDPVRMALGQPARFGSVPRRVGIAEPISVTTSVPESVPAVRANLTIRPAVPVRIDPVASHHFLIMPRTAWPSNCRVSIGWRHSSAAVTLFTDDGQEILVNLTDQTLTAFKDNRVVRTFQVSTGTPHGWATPVGTFWIYKRVRDDHMVGGDPHGPDHWDVEHVPYAQYFNDAIAIHGAWWNHRFGRAISHGCVQLPTDEGPHGPTGDPPQARWLWHFTDIGTPVTVTGLTPTSTTRTPIPYPPDSPWPTSARSGASSGR